MKDGKYVQNKTTTGQGISPYDPSHNSTSVLVGKSAAINGRFLSKKLSLILILLHGADEQLYAGTVADFSGMDPLIRRDPLRSEQYDATKLNGNIIYSHFFQEAPPFSRPPATFSLASSKHDNLHKKKLVHD